MRVVDLAFFVAEHDDHHLAAISELIRKFVS
jgi:mannitol/fructose-specific phosphotransferase system IIA component (Ntr-type)